MVTVALVGADGSGKSTIARTVAARLPRGRYMYMGVNLESSSLMLPSTRLVLELKRRFGGRPDLSAPSGSRHRARGLQSWLRGELRYANQIAEEWFRQLVAWYYARSGKVVIFDRHFVWDYHEAFVGANRRDVPALRRLHDRLLQTKYPRPDLVICLDAPAEVLFQRKKEGTLEDRERRRQEYLRQGASTAAFVRVDVNRPSHEVVNEVLDKITAHLDAGGGR